MRSAQPGIPTQDIANKISDTMFKPCHMTNLSPDLQRSFETASNNLSKDGFCHHLVLCQVGDVSTSANHASDTNVSPNKALELINKFMIKFNQRLYRGNIYQKPELGKYFYVFFFNSYKFAFLQDEKLIYFFILFLATFAFIFFCNIEEYLHILQTYKEFGSEIMKNFAFLVKTMRSPYCQVI